MSVFPYARWLRFAALQFHLAPDAFWRLSLAEWRALTAPQTAMLTRGDLDELMRLYPDH